MGGFFRRGETVVVDGGEKKWNVARVAPGYNAGEAVEFAFLIDAAGVERIAITDRLTKVTVDA